MDLAEKLSNVVNRYEEINSLISSPDCSPDDMVKMNKEIIKKCVIWQRLNITN